MHTSSLGFHHTLLLRWIQGLSSAASSGTLVATDWKVSHQMLWHLHLIHCGLLVLLRPRLQRGHSTAELQLRAPVPPVAPRWVAPASPQSRHQHAIVSYKHYQAAHPVVHTMYSIRQPPKTHAALVQQVHQALHKVPRNV